LKTTLHFGVLALRCHVATALKLWDGLLLSGSLHVRECLSRHFAYLNPIYNPAAQGSWAHSFTRLLTFTSLYHRTELCALYLEVLLCVRYLFGLTSSKVSRAEYILKFVFLSVNSTSSRAPFVKVIWYLFKLWISDAAAAYGESKDRQLL
jgi:hypothetical protein